MSGRDLSRSVSCSSPTVGGSSSLRRTSLMLGLCLGFAAVSHVISSATCAVTLHAAAAGIQALLCLAESATNSDFRHVFAASLQ